MSCMAVVVWPQTLALYNAGTEHAGFSPTKQTLLGPSAKSREVLVGESHGELHGGAFISNSRILSKSYANLARPCPHPPRSRFGHTAPVASKSNPHSFSLCWDDTVVRSVSNGTSERAARRNTFYCTCSRSTDNLFFPPARNQLT